VDEVPVGSSRAMALAPNLATWRFDSVRAPGVETLHWGFSIQYSTLYLTSRFDAGPPKNEPLTSLCRSWNSSSTVPEDNTPPRP
jgi:hypothetical protein